MVNAINLCILVCQETIKKCKTYTSDQRNLRGCSYKPCTKCTPVYIQMYPGKIVHIKDAKHFDLKVFDLVVHSGFMATYHEPR